MEQFKSPESEPEFPKYENLSEILKELLASQCGIEDAETYEIVTNAEEVDGGDMNAEEIKETLRRILESEK
ncbi:MAG: hypothetical protein AAB646_02900 [Patescibacteria group bacterium]